MGQPCTQQHMRHAGYRAEQPLGIKGEALTMVHVGFSQQGQVHTTHDILGRQFIALPQKQHQGIGRQQHHNGPWGTAGLEPQQQQSGSTIGQGQTLQHAQNAPFMGIERVPHRVTQRVDKQSEQKNEGCAA